MKIEGLANLEGFFNRMARDAETRTQEALERVVANIVADMKQRAPKDTGNLRNSIDWSRVADGVTIDVKASYAYFVEHGTMNTPAQPFFFPTLDEYRMRIAEEIAKEMRR